MIAASQADLRAYFNPSHIILVLEFLLQAHSNSVFGNSGQSKGLPIIGVSLQRWQLFSNANVFPLPILHTSTNSFIFNKCTGIC